MSHVLRGCPELLGKYMEHPWIIHGCLASYPPCQSIRGFPGYSEHPWIIHGRLASYPPPPPRQSIRGFPGYSEHPWIIHGCLASYPPPPCQSIRGFPGYSEHPWIIHGRLASYPPHVRVSVDSLDTLNIPESSMDAWLPTPPRQSIHGFPGYSEHP